MSDIPIVPIVSGPAVLSPDGHNINEPTGTPADTIAINDDDLGVDADPFIQAIAAEFERRTGNAPDDDVDDATDTPADDPNAPESVETHDPAAPDDGPEGESSTLPTGPATPPSPDADTISLAREEAQRLQALDQWAQSLTAEQRDQVDAVLSGGYDIIARGQAAPIPQSQPAPEDDEPYVDERAARDIAQLREQLATLSQSQQQQLQIEQQRRQSQFLDAVQTSSSAFSTKYALTAEELAQLQDATAQAQIIPWLSARYPNDPARAFSEALETVYWQTESFRGRELQRQVEAARVQDDELSKRRTKAGSLSGSGGSAPRSAPRPAALNREQRFAEMSKEIAAEVHGTN